MKRTRPQTRKRALSRQGAKKSVVSTPSKVRYVGQFSREAVVGAGGIDNQNKPVTDFLMTFTEYIALGEIKRPGTAIFKQAKGGTRRHLGVYD